VAEGGGLLNRYRVVKPYRGFESLRLRQCYTLKQWMIRRIQVRRLSQGPVAAGRGFGRRKEHECISSSSSSQQLPW
jgi:hypothetical protein